MDSNSSSNTNSSNGSSRMARSTSPSPLKSRHKHKTIAIGTGAGTGSNNAIVNAGHHTGAGAPARTIIDSANFTISGCSGHSVVRPCTLIRSSSQPEQSLHGVSLISSSSSSVLMMVMGNGSSSSSSGCGPIHDTTSSNSTIGGLNIMSVSDSGTAIPSVTLNSPLMTASSILDPIERQSLKHLSVSAPAIKSAISMGTSSSDNELMFAPTSSKSRQKKFHRHFLNVPQEEKVLDYYSCALVADILLQGYLYITENHFAFYSNVFGYVTKVLIPVCTIVRVTKEKTAKIIPNAVGIWTRTEKHVFASLISRDSTYKLMCKVWNYTVDNEVKTVQKISKIIPEDKGSGGDLSVPDESSGESGSGNDSAVEPLSYTPSPLNTPTVDKAKLLGSANATGMGMGMAPFPKSKSGGGGGSGSGSGNNSSSDNKKQPPTTLVNSGLGIVQSSATLTTTLPPAYIRNAANRTSMQGLAGAGAKTSGMASPFSKESGKQYLSTIRTGLQRTQNGQSLLVLATILLVVLFLSAALLLSRISNLQDKLSERPVFHDSDQFYQELLTWQNKLHSNSADEIHQYIHMNLKQITRVRQSLEALSLLFMTSQAATSGSPSMFNGAGQSTPDHHSHQQHQHLNNFGGQVNPES